MGLVAIAHVRRLAAGHALSTRKRPGRLAPAFFDPALGAISRGPTHHALHDHSRDAREHGLRQRGGQHVGGRSRPWRLGTTRNLSAARAAENVPELPRLLM